MKSYSAPHPVTIAPIRTSPGAKPTARPTLWGAFTAVLLLATGCSLTSTPEADAESSASPSPGEGGTRERDSTAPAEESERAGRALSRAETRRLLPTIAALPSGWSRDVDNTLSDHRPDKRIAARPARCDVFGPLDRAYLAAATKSYATFTASPTGPFLGVGVSSDHAVVPDGSLPTAVTMLRGCHRFAVDDGRETTKVIASTLSFPSLGDQTVAVRMVISSPTLAFIDDAVRIRVGHNIVALDAVRFGGRSTTKAMVRAARVAMENLAR